jgi:hypothetical protein
LKPSRHGRPRSSIIARCLVLTATTFAGLIPLAANAESERSGIEQIASALSGQATVSLDDWVALGAVAIGALLTVLYVRGMYLVLHYASATYSISLDRVDDADYSSSRERLLLSFGSVVLVVLSALIIASYGFGWQFLYIGPALSLLGPIVIIASMESDLRKYRRALGEVATGTQGVVAGLQQSIGA